MNKVRLFIALVLCCVFAVGCSQSESKARDEVRKGLSDPDSAKFGEFSEFDDRRACLTVNSRSDSGVYVGDHQAKLAKLADGAWVVIDMLSVSHESCVEAMNRNSELEWFHRETD